jgi:hypothetical protein
MLVAVAQCLAAASHVCGAHQASDIHRRGSCGGVSTTLCTRTRQRVQHFSRYVSAATSCTLQHQPARCQYTAASSFTAQAVQQCILWWKLHAIPMPCLGRGPDENLTVPPHRMYTLTTSTFRSTHPKPMVLAMTPLASKTRRFTTEVGTPPVVLHADSSSKCTAAGTAAYVACSRMHADDVCWRCFPQGRMYIWTMHFR